MMGSHWSLPNSLIVRALKGGKAGREGGREDEMRRGRGNVCMWWRRFLFAPSCCIMGRCLAAVFLRRLNIFYTAFSLSLPPSLPSSLPPHTQVSPS